MSWNYRVMREKGSLRFIEAYYHGSDKPDSYCEARMVGDTLKEIRWIADCLLAATKKPVLKISDFGKKK